MAAELLACEDPSIAGERRGEVMGTRTIFVGCAAAILWAGVVHAQVPPTAAPDQATLLKAADPKLAANKKLVFDMYRAIIQAGRTDLAPQYFTPDYIQHNPNVATGLNALAAYIKRTRPVRPIEPNITFPVIAIMAEGDLVTVAVVSYAPDPANPGTKYANTHFDMDRIEHGRIAKPWRPRRT